MNKILFFFTILFSVVLLGQSNQLSPKEIDILKRENVALKESLDACLKNSGKGSANIDKLIGEINKSNDYIKKLIKNNSKNDSLNLRLIKKIIELENSVVKNNSEKQSSITNSSKKYFSFKSIGYAITDKKIEKVKNIDFVKDDSILYLDLDNEIFVISNVENRVFYLTDFSPPTVYSNGDIITEFYAYDKNDKKYKIRFIEIKEIDERRNYNLQIYLDYENTLEVFEAIQ